jgi:hypothetical protein
MAQNGLELTVYSRYEHGNLSVRVFTNPESGDTNYEVGYATGTKVFTSARKMISQFYGHDIHMPFDRYFRLGRYRPRANGVGSANLLRLLDRKNPGHSPITVHTFAENAGRVLVTTKIAVSKAAKPSPRISKESSVPSVSEADEFFAAMALELKPEESFLVWTEEMDAALEKSLAREMDRADGILGIDLLNRSHEVRKLLFAGFAGKMLSKGYNPEDVLQEIYRGLLVRNKGTCPWDKRKSSFGHYVHMVISCVLTNYHRKESKRCDRDALPMESKNAEGDELPSHWGSVKIHHGSELGDQMALTALGKYLEGVPDTSPEAQVARIILPMVTAGCTRREIVAETGHKEGLVSRSLAWLRRECAIWATEMGMGRGVPLKYRLA